MAVEPEESPLTAEDIEIVEYLKPHLSTMPKPSHPGVYTRVIGLFLNKDNTDRANYVTGISGDPAASIAPWIKIAEGDRKQSRDGELIVLSKLAATMGSYAAKIEGTVYIVQDVGPCGSCRKVIKTQFHAFYRKIRIVLWYGQSTAGVGGKYTVGNAREHASGYIVVWPPKSSGS